MSFIQGFLSSCILSSVHVSIVKQKKGKSMMKILYRSQTLIHRSRSPHSLRHIFILTQDNQDTHYHFIALLSFPSLSRFLEGLNPSGYDPVYAPLLPASLCKLIHSFLGSQRFSSRINVQLVLDKQPSRRLLSFKKT